MEWHDEPHTQTPKWLDWNYIISASPDVFQPSGAFREASAGIQGGRGGEGEENQAAEQGKKNEAKRMQSQPATDPLI